MAICGQAAIDLLLRPHKRASSLGPLKRVLAYIFVWKNNLAVGDILQSFSTTLTKFGAIKQASVVGPYLPFTPPRMFLYSPVYCVASKIKLLIKTQLQKTKQLILTSCPNFWNNIKLLTYCAERYRVSRSLETEFGFERFHQILLDPKPIWGRTNWVWDKRMWSSVPFFPLHYEKW